MPEVMSETVFKAPFDGVIENVHGQNRVNFQFACKIDLFHPADGLIVDYKSVSDIDMFMASRKVSRQLELYALTLMRNGHTVQNAEYRVIQKPSLRPSRSDMVEKKISYKAYENRCCEWLDMTKSATVVVPITEESLISAEWWALRSFMNMALLMGMKSPIENPSACFSYNYKCPFLEICDNTKCGMNPKTTINTLYKERPFRHSELGEGYDECMTYSELEMFSSCSARWWWKYIKRLESNETLENESLALGSIFHDAMDILHKTGDLDTALSKVYEWEAKSKFSGSLKGPDQASTIAAKTRAMVRVAKEKWYASA